jgi:aminopeptidase N
MRRLAPALVLVAALGPVAALTGCSGSDSAASAAAPAVDGTRVAGGATTYDRAVSTPHEDSVYPDVGDPGVDALHYGLDLTWNARHRVLHGVETLQLRAPVTADHLSLDLARQLEVGHVWLDGKEVAFQHPGKDLVVEAPVTEGDRYDLQLTYAGTPEPVTAPTDRGDFSTTGWTATGDGSVWTMQEPYGAYSWYAVNDQPSDKAFYSFTIRAPQGMTGVANGRPTRDDVEHGLHVTRYVAADPMASYLVTIAIGHLTRTRDRGPHGLAIDYWTPADRPRMVRQLRYTPQALRFLERRLGPYPFGRDGTPLSVLVVPSSSAMETQGAITLGETTYTQSHDVIVHELAHQWYGDLVTPGDWSDLWMSEGMATYVAEATWTAAHGPQSRDRILRGWAHFVGPMRADYGPPASYRPGSFGEGNAYYIPALMWDTIRQRLGDQEFWRLVRQWPRSHAYTSQDRDTLAAWWSRRSGQDLTPLFHRWLLAGAEPTWRPHG